MSLTVEAAPDGIADRMTGLAGRGARSWWAVLALGTAVIIIAPVFAPYGPTQAVAPPFLPPGARVLFGTDDVGHDVLSRVLFGMRSTWIAALIVISIGVLIGGAIGTVAGLAAGWLDNLLMRVTDGFLALPGPVLAIAITASIGPSFEHTLIAISIVWWPYYARIVRGEVRALAARPFVEAARHGSRISVWRLAVRHVLPGAAPAVIVAASLDVGNLILMLAGLSFLGLGAPAPAPELGGMTAQGLSYLLTSWWIPIMPGLAVLALALGSNFLGDGIRNAMGGRG
ncbi:MAG TPA: ABC transporter permease [Streptosporangiaceae bacterium]